jgi:hypothetical protein
MKYFRYVRLEDVLTRLAQGWMVDGVCPGHHGVWSVLMVWLCDCEVPT